MSWIDWLVLGATLLFIVLYGIYRSRGSKNISGYLLADQSMPWYVVGISVMATQASAITFLSAPGQAYVDGMRFVQFYFGLPLAMIFICIFFLPVYHRLKVYTAYEYLEGRFDFRTRALTAFLFLLQRGIACGLTIYAPAIILSSLLGWNIYLTNLFIGGLVVVYTMAGGTKAVSVTQMQQMAVIFTGMVIAAYMIVKMLPDSVSFIDALHIAGKQGKLNAIDFSFDWRNQYNIWSGLIGGFFLALSYFGTDQSQVGRYLSGKSVDQSRLGLLFNAVLKIPMQFSILLIGALLFVFYQFHQPPLHFNSKEVAFVKSGNFAGEYRELELQHEILFSEKQEKVYRLNTALKNGSQLQVADAREEIRVLNIREQVLKNSAMELMKKNNRHAETNDTNYIFLNYVTNFLPVGLIGLLIAVIFSASMSSTSSELNALTSTTVVDIYKRIFTSQKSDQHYLWISKVITVFWGVVAILVAMYANRLGSLIEAVNKLGSLFYGTILGIFITAFFLKKVTGTTVFYSALVAESAVLLCYYFDVTAFLWLNMIGCIMVAAVSWIATTSGLSRSIS